MTIKTIPNFLAADLAHAYHQAMKMVERRSTLHTNKSARATLDEYLSLCGKVGINMHNDSWLEIANDVVREIEEYSRGMRRKFAHNANNNQMVGA